MSTEQSMETGWYRRRQVDSLFAEIERRKWTMAGNDYAAVMQQLGLASTASGSETLQNLLNVYLAGYK